MNDEMCLQKAVEDLGRLFKCVDKKFKLVRQGKNILFWTFDSRYASKAKSSGIASSLLPQEATLAEAKSILYTYLLDFMTESEIIEYGKTHSLIVLKGINQESGKLYCFVEKVLEPYFCKRYLGF